VLALSSRPVVLEILEADVLVGFIEDCGTHKTELFLKGDKLLVPSKKFWETMRKGEDNIVSKSTRAAISDLGLSEQDCPAAGFVYVQEGQTQLMIGRAWRGRDVVWGGANYEKNCTSMAF